MSRILVVDDEPDLRCLVRKILERAGHEVVDAGHGEAALEHVRRALPDLVMTDLMMPVMGGLELIRRLRADPTTAGIPILVATGDPHLVRGADATLPKPYQRDDLVAAANALLAKKQEHLS